MAQVFLALASGPAGFNKLVVIKQIRPQFAEDPEFLTMFLDEARLAARLNHPNVVQTNEVGGTGGRFYICMEYLEGQPFNRILSKLGSAAAGLTLGMQLRILVDALAGLHHAHELCDFDGKPLLVVHRDATPHNIFLTYAGQVKVVDFGIAKALSSSSETRTGVLKGKVAYMAPEQAMGERVDRRADLFSVGMILWETLAGKRPFKGLPDVAVLQRIVNGGVPSPRTVKEDIAAELERICMKALEHKRDDRYATAADMAADLEKAVEDLGLRGSLRDAGKLIEQFFAGDRAKIKQLVEMHASENRVTDWDPRMSGSGPHVPVFDDHMTVETMKFGSAPREGGSSLRTQGGAPRSASGSLRTPEDKSGSHEPSHPSTLTSATASSPLSTPLSEPPARGRTVAMVIAGVAGAAVAIAVFAGRGRANATPAPAAPPSAAAAPRVHTIMIDSMPQGATIREGDKELGKTPMTLDLDLTSSTQRRLVMSLDGYTPHTFIPTREDVRIQVPLSAVPAAPQPEKVAEKPAEKPALPKGVPYPLPHPPPAAPATKPVVPSDINMAR
jgi:serine/threonine-protein kinase